jgi:long-chain acyl-CoA synthetase
VTNLCTALTASAKEYPYEPALRHDDRTLTFAQLDDLAARAAALLTGFGVEPGDRVAIMLPNIPEFAVLYYGALRAGAVVVPMNPQLKVREVEHYLSDSGAVAVFFGASDPDEAAAGARAVGVRPHPVDPEAFLASLAELEPRREPVERGDDDTAIILYTSGTTGRSKGAELTHSNLRHNSAANARHMVSGPGERLLGVLPLFHVFGLVCLLGVAVGTGGCLTLVERFDAEKVLDVIVGDRIEVFAGVPTMYAALVAAYGPDDHRADSLRIAVSGGAALPVRLLHEIERMFPVRVLEGYGMSETSPTSAVNPVEGVRKPGSIGLPIEGIEMRVVDDDGWPVPVGEIGEIQVRGHNVMKGYWRQPAETAAVLQNGWLSTGDLARVDEDGYYFIVDRKKDLIIRGGYNVYPREIEEVLHEHPDIAEAAVVGIAHDSLGEEVGAAVVLKAGASTSPEDLREFVKARVAAYKYPRHIWLVDALPKGPTGKILRREITAK